MVAMPTLYYQPLTAVVVDVQLPTDSYVLRKHDPSALVSAVS